MKKNLAFLFIISFCTNLYSINITATITSGGVTRSFIIHAPGTSVASNLPVVYVLHGDGGSGAGIKSYSGFDSIADQNNFMAVYPTAHQAGGLWNKYVDFVAGDAGSGNINAVDDVQFFSDLTTYLCTTYNINSTKVYATGHSGGAYMCYNLALQLPNKIAGIAPIAGSCWGDNVALNTIFTSATYKKVPVYHIHGDADATVSYPDADHTPVAWAEWPFSFFGNYSCGNATYTSTTNIPGTTTIGSVKKLQFCGGPAPANKEVYLIRIVGGGHGWPTAAGYKPALAIWNFFNQYNLPTAPGCAPPPPITGNVVGGIAGPNVGYYIHTDGKYIIGPMGDTVVMRGVNYAPYNWGWDPTELRINEIALSNANAVRLVWYKNPTAGSVYPNYTALDSAISKCKQAGMIAIPELHDQTCTHDSAGLTSLISWWTHPSMQAILAKYPGYVIVNFANEALGDGAWSWMGGSPSSYKNIYGNIITQLRAISGFNYPIMIDVPNCANTETAMWNNNVATYLNSIDPLHNLIYSVHTYWTMPTNTASVVSSRVNAISTSNLPFVIGEIAKTADCSDVILADSILKYAKQKDIGWLAWSWDRDNCAARQLTTNGLFSSLTAAGSTFISNAQYGMTNTAVKILPSSISMPLTLNSMQLNSSNIANGYNLFWTKLEDIHVQKLLISEDGKNYKTVANFNASTNSYNYFRNFTQVIYCKIEYITNNGELKESNTIILQPNKTPLQVLPNPASEYISISGLTEACDVHIVNTSGAVVVTYNNVNTTTKINVQNLPNGLYALQIKNTKTIATVLWQKTN